jgi:hypothetical protein
MTEPNIRARGMDRMMLKYGFIWIGFIEITHFRVSFSSFVRQQKKQKCLPERGAFAPLSTACPFALHALARQGNH